MGLLFLQARPGPGREDTAGTESESIRFSLPPPSTPAQKDAGLAWGPLL